MLLQNRYDNFISQNLQCNNYLTTNSLKRHRRGASIPCTSSVSYFVQFAYLSGLSTFSAFKKSRKTESLSFLLQNLHSLCLLFFKHCHELLRQNDILDINRF